MEFRIFDPYSLINEIDAFCIANFIDSYNQYEINEYDNYFGIRFESDFVLRMRDAGFNKFFDLERVQ